ncbi:MAG: hypothetical protein ACYSSO_06960 [Planctomycetota bacterium]|jgi:hypothetical protein
MPIVDGQYQAKISTTFHSTKEAIAVITDKIEKSKKVRISNIPMDMLKNLLPLLKGKDVKIILPMNSKPTSELKQLGDVAVQKAKIYKDYKGVEANAGSIYFADRIFGVVWDKNGILEIDAMDYDKCVKCMKKMFDVGWRYSEK